MNYFKTYPSTQSVPLDPRLKALIESEPDQLYLLPVEQFRAASGQQFTRTPKLKSAVKAIENRSVPGPGGEIPIRVYRPEGRGPFPTLAVFHGSGWVVGTLDTHDDLCRALAHRAGSIVVSVDMSHGFILWGAMFDSADRALQEIADALKDAFLERSFAVADYCRSTRPSRRMR
jgi:hypothetical protein